MLSLFNYRMILFDRIIILYFISVFNTKSAIIYAINAQKRNYISLLTLYSRLFSRYHGEKWVLLHISFHFKYFNRCLYAISPSDFKKVTPSVIFRSKISHFRPSSNSISHRLRAINFKKALKAAFFRRLCMYLIKYRVVFKKTATNLSFFPFIT